MDALICSQLNRLVVAVLVLFLLSGCTTNLDLDEEVSLEPTLATEVVETEVASETSSDESAPTTEMTIVPTPIASEQKMVSPDNVWTAKRRLEIMRGESEVEFIIEGSDDSFSLITGTRKRGRGYSLPSLLGWTDDSRYFYFAEGGLHRKYWPEENDSSVIELEDGSEVVVDYDECGGSFFRDIRRFDTQTREVESIYQATVSSVAFSPDNQTIALKPLVELNNDSGDVLVLDIDSAEILSTFPIDAVFESGLYQNELIWSSDGSLLLTKLNTHFCEVESNQVAFQINDTLIFSSADMTRYIGTGSLDVFSFTSTQLEIRDGYTGTSLGCSFSVDLQSNTVSSEDCADKLLKEGDFQPVAEPSSPAVSPDGRWEVSRELAGDENGDPTMTLAVNSTETEVRYESYHAAYDFAETNAEPIALSWSSDSRYFFFSLTTRMASPDSCEDDILVYSNLGRLDVESGEVRTILEEEIASVAFSFDGQKVAYILKPDPGDQSVTMTVLDSQLLNQISTHLLPARYVDGGTAHNLSWSADGRTIIGALHTTECLLLEGQVDFWQIDADNDSDLFNGVDQIIFSSEDVTTSDQDTVLTVLGVDNFLDGILQVSDKESGCLFSISAETLTITSPNCPHRIRK